MKRKTMTMMLCLLCTLALVSVGFASWVISTSTTVQQEGNIVVESVTDNRVNVSVKFLSTTENNEIIFGRPKNYTEKVNDWLKNDGNGKEENFTLKFKVAITDKEDKPIELNTNSGDILNFEFGLNEDDNTTYTNCVNYTYSKDAENSNRNLVLALTSDNVNITYKYINASDSGSGEEYYEVSVVIGTSNDDGAWGTAFGSKNPYNYYNSIENPTEAQITEAYDLLNALCVLNDIKYTFKVTAKRNS